MKNIDTIATRLLRGKVLKVWNGDSYVYKNMGDVQDYINFDSDLAEEQAQILAELAAAHYDTTDVKMEAVYKFDNFIERAVYSYIQDNEKLFNTWDG